MASLRRTLFHRALTNLAALIQTEHFRSSVVPFNKRGRTVAQRNHGVIPVLPVGVYRATFAGDTKARRFPESAWRGALGHALRRVACVTREKHCPDCLLYRSCGYAYIFETPPPVNAAKMRRYVSVPHPFTLRVEQHQDQSALFSKPGVSERVNLQRDGTKAKPYQVRQVRTIIAKYRLGGE